MIPGEIVDVLAVRRDYLQAHPEAAPALRKAWFSALEHLRTARGESAKVLAAREKVSPEQFLNSLGGLQFPNEQENRSMLEGPKPQLLGSAQRLKSVMRDSGLLQKDIPLEPLFLQPETRSRDPKQK
jgi:NitT/TauT family transport system substrate-binding protein